MKPVLFIFFTAIVFHIQAQSLLLLGSGGDSSQSLDWSLGEPFIDTHVSDHTLLTQGFQQPLISSGSTPVSDVPLSDAEVRVWPNPTSDFIYLETEMPVAVQLYSLTGKTVLSHTTPTKQRRVDISSLTPGFYWLQLTDESGIVVKTVKVIIAKP